MKKVDYLKLSEQYASFLVAVGGVSITVLTLVLTFGSESLTPKVNSRSFLVAALVVATVACFIGAHMLAETAAFISNAKEKAKEIAERKQDNTSQLGPLPSPEEIVSGVRLFLLASTNIFIAIILVLFALMLLPTSSRRVDAASLAPISVGVFLVIVAVAVYWMILAAKYRVPVSQSGRATWSSIIILSELGVILYSLPISNEWLLCIAFAPSALSTVISLVWFSWIFKEGNAIRLHKARNQDIWFFSLAISLSYTPLVVAGIKIMLGKQFAAGEF